MIVSGAQFANVWQRIHKDSLVGIGLIRFVKFIERRLGVSVLYNKLNIPYGRDDLIDLFELAANLKEVKVIKSVMPLRPWSDEPRLFQWRVECATKDSHVAGGSAVEGDREALIPALAEAVERYIWMVSTDYFDSPRTATSVEIQSFGQTVLPKQFVGFSDKQRAESEFKRLADDAKYLWIRGTSHTNNKSTWIPAQVISGAHGVRAIHHQHEPMILSPITTGLATGPTREYALLNGAMEILERDAFMITWLNQLSPSRINITDLAKTDPSLQKLIEMCTRYRLKLEAVLMPSDAPTYTVCAVVTDESGSSVGPEVTVGLKAHRSLAAAVKGACLEAIRIRQTIRYRQQNSPLDPRKKPEDIVHVERAQYWGKKGSATKLAFLTAGEELVSTSAPWENDTVKEHWARVVAWCQENNYECASVDLTKSKHNVTPWHIHMVVMPEMQPMHQTERLIYLGGERLDTIPKKYGYASRPKPYSGEPHPFA